MKSHTMPVASNQEVSWNLSDDRKTVRLDIPPLRLARIRQPIVVQICFDAMAVDTILNSARNVARTDAAEAAGAEEAELSYWYKAHLWFVGRRADGPWNG